MSEKRFALIIANDQYNDESLRKLQAPQFDADALAKVLGDPETCDFYVQILVNRKSHRVNQVIEAFFKDRARDDLLLLYFSGHGVKDEDGKLYFATPDTRRDMLMSTAVSASFVNELMRRTHSRRQVLLLDCCYSGAFAKGMIAKSGAVGTSIRTNDFFQGKGRVVLTASDAMQYAFEEDELVEEGSVSSIFTAAIVDGIETWNADSDNDNRILITELYDYVDSYVHERTPHQRPSMWSFDVQGDIVIAKRVVPEPSEEIVEIPLPSPTPRRARPESFIGGLERATPLERFISLFHIPYYLGCLLISSIVGPPGAILLCYSKTQDIHFAISKTVWLFVGLEMPEFQGIFALFLIFSILFYCTYIVRFMRMRLISAKEKLIPILPDETIFQNAFKSVISVRNPILLGALIILTANLETLDNFLGFGTAQVDLIYFTLCLIGWSIIAGQFVWVYLSSILGLHNLGRSDLKLLSHHEDNMLGVKPIGSLSLSLAITYLTLFGAFVLLATLFQAGNRIFVILIATLILSGVITFFLPLISTRKRMLEAKNRELMRIEQMLIKATETLKNNVKDGSEEDIPGIDKTLKHLTTTITIDIQREARADVREWPTWPIDKQIISRLGTMMITITCTILANMILRMIRL